MFSVWPEKEPAQLVDVVTRDEIMEQVLEAYVYLLVGELVDLAKANHQSQTLGKFSNQHRTQC